MFFHGTSGTAAAFFYQVQALSEKGYRVVSVQYPAYDSAEEWAKGLDRFLDALKLRTVHIFGAGLGGFLSQHFTVLYPHRVRSLMLCNAFGTTCTFAEKAGALAGVVGVTPTLLLRKVVLDSFPQAGMEMSAKQAIDWVASQVNDLSGDDLASRLSLNCTASTTGSLRLEDGSVTILESNGDTMVPEELRRDLRGRYPGARVSQLKAGGDFPYLSRPEEATMFIEVHMRGAGVYVGGAGAVGYATTMPVEAPVAEEAKRDDSPPPRRPVWVNPFEDDPLL